MKPTLKSPNVWPSHRGLRGPRAPAMPVIHARRDDDRIGSSSVRSWWQTYLLLWRHLFARLTYIHTQIAYWKRHGATRQLRSDVHRAVVCLRHDDLTGALEELPSYRSPPDVPVDCPPGSQRGMRMREREPRA